MIFESKSAIVKHAIACGQPLKTGDVTRSRGMFFIKVDGITSETVTVCTGEREYFGPGAERAHALHNIFKQSNVKV